MSSLQGKTVLVTGAASGIGAAVVEELVNAGATVLAADREEADELPRPHRRLIVDVSNEASVESAFEGVTTLDGLVNAAGITEQGPIQTVDMAQWQKVIGVNLTGTMLMARHATNLMLQNKLAGSIVNISSAYGLTGGPGNVAYNVSKSGVAQLTRCMAADLGRNNIRVNAVCPGYIETPMTDMLKHAGAFRDQFVAMHLLQRPGLPGEVAKAICFLLSDDASYISGVNLPVDGGFTAAHMPPVNL